MFYKKKYYSLITLAILILLILHQINFWKNLYLIYTKKIEERLLNIYGYCEKESYGFLKHIKSKYKLEKNLKIINYEIVPNSLWIVYDSKKEIDDKPKIFLNYIKNQEMSFFSYNEKLFINQINTNQSNGIISINFSLKNKTINFNGPIIIFKIINKKKIIIFSKDINQTIYNKQDIAINFKTSKINDRWNKFYIEIPNTNQKNQIQKITLKLSNEYNIDNMNVIENFGNCYYVK